MQLDELQAQVAPWAAHNLPNDTVVVGAAGLAEEAGEVCRAAVKDIQGIRGTHEEWMDELAKELGDVVIKAAHVATLAGFDFGSIVRDRWAVIQQRDFVANRQGHGLPDAATD
jgi:NTP pyrophosphatase (non-canonical NTP hydrolase)